MFLVHISLRPRWPAAEMPPSAAESIARSCTDRDGFEHVSVHPGAFPDPVVGFYVQAGSLEEAETAALSLWGHASSTVAELQAWEPTRAEVPLFRPDLQTDPPPGLGWTE
ncbi:hypothetical protein GCM10011579_093170 [Streptomyces albiflavescens]|uniref:Uncharacterized protein n=1 Tax=Streptomyces albiflavescens TaxID=1623582 RepID=A0A917YGI9_9ACTN|nr:hypothetical protein GCM10011579_093170 [Streptomyces albiflavescens]